jgi:hypothetical protein
MPPRIGSHVSRNGVALVLSSLLATPFAAGCQSTNSGPDAGPKGPTGNVVLTDLNNYTSQSSLTIPSVQTASGVDLDICWTSITKDILCHDLTPTTDIDNVSFLQLLNLTEDQIAVKLAAGQLTTSYVKTYRDFHVDHSTGATCTKLSALSLSTSSVNPAQDYLASDTAKYMLLFSTGTTPGSGARTMLFLEPSAASTNTEVAAPDGCGILQFAADLTTPAPVPIPVAGPWVVDWSQLTKDGAGNPVVFQNIDSLLVGFYQGKTVADLQAQFLDIDRIATSLYKLAIPTGAKTADLANAETAAGEAFAGFTQQDGVWAVGLLCSTCQIPAPVALSILAPAAN